MRVVGGWEGAGLSRTPKLCHPILSPRTLRLHVWGQAWENRGCVSRSVLSDSLRPHGLQPARLLHLWDSPGQSTGVGCPFLLQGIFLTQRSNLGLPHCRPILYR